MYLVLIVLAIYLILVVGISVKLKGDADSVEGFFLAKRSTPLPILILTVAATWIGASSTLGKSGLGHIFRIQYLQSVCRKNSADWCGA